MASTYTTRDRGLKIQYSTWGPLDSGHVTLYFHGFPGSHLQAQFLEKLFVSRGWGLIAADRPGYGGTDLHTPRDTQSYIQGLTEILDYHGVKRFSILGVSGGAPMAHLMASHCSERVDKLVVVCGLATYGPHTLGHFSEFQRRGLMLAHVLPSFLLLSIANLASRFFNPAKKIEKFVKFLNSADRDVLLAPQNRDLLLASMNHARLQKAKGILWDTKLFSMDWFEKACKVENLSRFPVYYFHGGEDWLLSPEMAKSMHRQVPHSKLVIYENEGHYSLPFRRAREILDSLV